MKWQVGEAFEGARDNGVAGTWPKKRHQLFQKTAGAMIVGLDKRSYLLCLRTSLGDARSCIRGDDIETSVTFAQRLGRRINARPIGDIKALDDKLGLCCPKAR